MNKQSLAMVGIFCMGACASIAFMVCEHRPATEYSTPRWTAGSGIHYPKGTEFWSPLRTKGYRLLRDVKSGDPLRSADVEPLGNEVAAAPGENVPEYFAICTRRQCE